MSLMLFQSEFPTSYSTWCVADILLFCVIILMLWVRIKGNVNYYKCGPILGITCEIYGCSFFVDRTIFFLLIFFFSLLTIVTLNTNALSTTIHVIPFQKKRAR